MLLHGFPMFSDVFVGLMNYLSDNGYNSLACDQRGYSKGASPDDINEYD